VRDRLLKDFYRRPSFKDLLVIPSAMLHILFRGATRSILIQSQTFWKPGSCFSNSGRKLISRSVTQQETKAKEGDLVKDILLFRHEKPRTYGYISVFAFFQLTFWMVMGRNMMDMKDLPVDPSPDTPFFKKINWGDKMTKNIMAATCFAIGSLSICLGWFYVIRSVRYLVLRKNREVVSVVTFTPFGRNRFIEVPLDNISCQGSRTDVGFMPLKIKGRYFKFVVDSKSGVFPNTKLFDQTVEIHRKL